MRRSRPRLYSASTTRGCSRAIGAVAGHLDHVGRLLDAVDADHQLEVVPAVLVRHEHRRRNRRIVENGRAVRRRRQDRPAVRDGATRGLLADISERHTGPRLCAPVRAGAAEDHARRDRHRIHRVAESVAVDPERRLVHAFEVGDEAGQGGVRARERPSCPPEPSAPRGTSTRRSSAIHRAGRRRPHRPRHPARRPTSAVRHERGRPVSGRTRAPPPTP
jgi:hypothetical protein